jgi:hypothetical protein
MQLERDVPQRLDAFERARDRGGPERLPGPPGLGRGWRSVGQIFGVTFAVTDVSTRERSFSTRMTRYLRPNTVCSCAEKLTFPDRC